MKKIDKILGGLVGGAAGDAMGAATELRTRKQIEDLFGNYVTEFLTPPNDTFARGGKPGEVTDDFSIAYYTCQEIVREHGVVNHEVSKNSLIKWSNTQYFERFSGPTTRAAINKMKGIVAEEGELFIPVNDNTKATNGLGMKIAPIALFANGDIDEAIEIACTIGMDTHDNQIALSAGCAIAAAAAKAYQDDATLIEMVHAGLYGAKKGEEWGEANAQTLAGPSVYKRIKLAVSIGIQSENLSEAINNLSDIIGSGLHAAEAIPTVFGLLVASKGNTMDAIYGGVNIGNDTDTVATMVGALLGILNGIQSLPENYLSYLDKANNFEMNKLAKEMDRILNG